MIYNINPSPVDFAPFHAGAHWVTVAPLVITRYWIMKWISPFVYRWFIKTMGLCKHLTRVMYKVFAQIDCHYKPTIHKGWNSFYIFTLFSCVLILFYRSLSWKWLCFSWKSNGMHSKWKSLEKIVRYDSNLVIIDTKRESIFHRVL